MLGLRKGGETKEHDVEHYTQRPNVTGTRIAATPDDLRSSVKRSPESLVEKLVSLDLGGEAEVRYLDRPLGRQFIDQQVFWLRGSGTSAGKAQGWGTKRYIDRYNTEVHRMRVSRRVDKNGASPRSEQPPHSFNSPQASIYVQTPFTRKPPQSHTSHYQKGTPIQPSDTQTRPTRKSGTRNQRNDALSDPGAPPQSWP